MVPDGFRAVLREILVGYVLGPNLCAALAVSAGPAGIIYEQLASRQSGTYYWDGRVVMDPGDELEVNCGVNWLQATVYAGGYLLTLP